MKRRTHARESVIGLMILTHQHNDQRSGGRGARITRHPSRMLHKSTPTTITSTLMLNIFGGGPLLPLVRRAHHHRATIFAKTHITARVLMMIAEIIHLWLLFWRGFARLSGKLWKTHTAKLRGLITMCDLLSLLLGWRQRITYLYMAACSSVLYYGYCQRESERATRWWAPKWCELIVREYRPLTSSRERAKRRPRRPTNAGTMT